MSESLQESLERILQAVAYRPRLSDVEADREAWLAAKAARDRDWAERMALAGVDANADIDDIDDDVAEDLIGWAVDPDGRNLLLFGPAGVGKTYAAIAAARYRWDHGSNVRFYNVVRLLADLRPHAGQDWSTHDKASAVDILILDDLGAQKDSEWTAEQLYAVVSYRDAMRHPTIVTTNLLPSDFRHTIGDRLWSRLTRGDTVELVMHGPDRRRT